jgi:hypothetical protein
MAGICRWLSFLPLVDHGAATESRCMAIIILTSGLALLGGLAALFGADSRDGQDWCRRT